MVSEYFVRVEARGRTVDQWQLRPARDNHWLDCIVGAMVAASLAGVALFLVTNTWRLADGTIRRLRKCSICGHAANSSEVFD